MICCIKASHHKAPAIFASIHFCSQPFYDQSSATSPLHPAFGDQLFASSLLRPAAFIHPIICLSEVCHNPIQDHEPDNTREDILEVEPETGGHLKPGTGIDLFHIIVKSPAVLPRTEERDNHGADWQHGVGTTRGKTIDALIHGADCVTLLLPLWRKAQVHARIRDED